MSNLEVPAPRIGVLRQDFAGPVDADAVQALDRAAAALERAGAKLGSASEPESMRQAWRAQPTIQSYEAGRSLAWEYDHHRDLLPPLLRATLDEEQNLTAEDYDDARRHARRAQQGMDELFGEFDALLTYSAAGAAPRGLGSTGEARFNRLLTLLGVPCVNVPGLSDREGMPIGIQIVAPYGREDIALAVGYFLERALTERS